MVRNYGDRTSPNWGCGNPFQMALLLACQWAMGVTNHLLTGMALQVVGPHVLAKTILLLAKILYQFLNLKCFVPLGNFDTSLILFTS